MQLPKFLMYSVNPQNVAMTVKGFLVGIILVVVIVSGLAHLNLGQDQITQFVDALIGLVSSLSAVASAAMIVFGVARKIGVGLGLIKPVQ